MAVLKTEPAAAAEATAGAANNQQRAAKMAVAAIAISGGSVGSGNSGGSQQSTKMIGEAEVSSYNAMSACKRTFEFSGVGVQFDAYDMV